MSKLKGTARIARDNSRRPEPNEPEFALRRLVVVRESDASDHVLFEDMVYKTMAQFVRDLPHLEPLMTAGLAPFDTPEAYSAIVESRRRTKSATFAVDDTIVFYHLGSAAKVAEGEDINYFTEQLLNLVIDHPITKIFAFNVNRLVRDDEHAMRLGAELAQRRIEVCTQHGRIDFNEPMGPAQWAMAAHFAAAERRGIVERNRLGKVAAARRAQWPNGPDRVPLGYRLEGGTIVPVEDERERVAKVLGLMADPDLSNKQFVEQLGALSVDRLSVERMLGPGKTLQDVKHPKDVRTSFERYLTLYESGVYEVLLPNPSPGAQMFGGLPVHRTDPADPGYIVLPYAFGVPDGGWADPVVFDAIRRRSEADGAYRNGTRKRRPFSGRPMFERDGITFQIDTGTFNGYRLRRARPGAPAGNARASVEMETLASVEAGELHRAVARGVVAAISATTGADGVLRPGALTVRLDPQARLDRSIAYHEERAANARRAVLEATDEPTRAAFLEVAEREARAATALGELDPAESAAPPVPDEVQVDIAGLLKALAHLERADSVLDGDLCSAIATVIPNLELFAIGRTDALGWSAVVRIATTDGLLLELGPIAGEVTTRRRRSSPGKRGELAHTMLLAYGDGLSVGATAAEAGSLPAYGYKLLRDELVRLGFPVGSASHLRSAPVPELRELAARAALAGIVPELAEHDDAALEDLLDEHEVVPTGCDIGWAIATLRRYAEPLPHGPWAWSNSNVIGQEVIDVVVAAGGSITVRELIERYASETMSRAAVLQRAFGTQLRPPVLERVEPWVTKRGRAEPDNRMTLVACKHCGGYATVHLRAAEIPGALLCDTCHHNPWVSYEFPAGYFAVARGAHYVNPVTAQQAQDPVPAGAKKVNRRQVTNAQAKRIVADYRAGLALAGADGLLAKHNIPTSRLYPTIDAAGVPRRQPKRSRSAPG